MRAGRGLGVKLVGRGGLAVRGGRFGWTGWAGWFVGSVCLVAVLLALGLSLPVYWVYLLSTVGITALIARGVGVVTERTGLITLCQMSFAAIGGWVVSWAAIALPSVPFPVLIVLAGAVATPIGALVGVATARIRGIELAIVTLGLAAALDLVLRQGSFPGVGSGTPVIPAPPFDDPRGFFALSWGTLLVIQLLLFLAERSRLGASWAAVKSGERAAAALGVPAVGAKAAAFGVGAFCAGVAGGLLAGQYGLLTTAVFSPLTSMMQLVTAVLCGAGLFGGAVLAGVLSAFMPEILRRVGLPLDVGNALLALGAFDVLRRGTGGMAEQVRRLIQARRFRDTRVVATLPNADVRAGDGAYPDGVQVKGAHPDSVQVNGAHPDGVHVNSDHLNGAHLNDAHLNGAHPHGVQAGGRATREPHAALWLGELTVDRGETRVLDGVDLTLGRYEVHALIGPNGAGKSTLVDAVTGFLPVSSGSVSLAGVALDGLRARARAVRGLRRTFQHTTRIDGVTVGEYLRLAAGRDSRAGSSRAARIVTVREHFGLPADAVPIRLLDAGTLRVLEVAGAVISRPVAVLLDEPAAGLGVAESAALASCVRRIPEVFGSSVLVIEHDMGFVRECASRVTVLEEGRVIASGPVAETLEQPRVVAAYVGSRP